MDGVTPRRANPNGSESKRSKMGSGLVTKALLPLLVVMVCVWPTVLMGAPTGPVVGSVTIEMDNRTTSRRVLSELWFEAAAVAQSEPYATQPLFRPGPSARGAGKRPLIVISHGNFGSRFSHAWLAVELVKSGYVVLSTSHPGTMGEDQTPAGRYRLWDLLCNVQAGAALRSAK